MKIFQITKNNRHLLQTLYMIRIDAKCVLIILLGLAILLFVFVEAISWQHISASISLSCLRFESRVWPIKAMFLAWLITPDCDSDTDDKARSFATIRFRIELTLLLKSNSISSIPEFLEETGNDPSKILDKQICVKSLEIDCFNYLKLFICCIYEKLSAKLFYPAFSKKGFNAGSDFLILRSFLNILDKKYTYIWNQRVKIYKNHYRKVKKCEKSYFRPDCPISFNQFLYQKKVQQDISHYVAIK
ncbi:hypothetical protein BpHYR1_053139 [Brachionus plicatilis]|uniref:Uncharacterized protein n=1 Tax=Brachionus plicatilis TaxID=10195 RepID=A0A3M7SE42_BRAPC|nr:hypothetical protein BpHYR1_053139 [Brachionus plicatilis]